MNKSKSQWDFGELFPTEATRKVFSVGELTEQIRRLLEKQVGQVLGERRGHQFSRAIFRPYLFHAQGCQRADQLRFISRRNCSAS